MNIQEIEIDKLIPYHNNPRKNQAVNKVASSLKEYGFQQPIVTDKDLVLIVGHTRLLAAKKLGLSKVPVLVADLSEAKAKAYRIADNRLNEDSEWDIDLLTLEISDLLEQNYELDLLGFDANELDKFLVNEEEYLKDEDEVPPEPEQATSVLGDVWRLGKHKIICGDSTSIDVWQKLLGDVKPHLMVTDPPYGVEYDANWRNNADRSNGKKIGGRATGKVLNDDKADWREVWSLFEGDVAYVWHAGLYAGVVADSLVACDFNLRSQIIWAKSNFAIGRGDYHWHHEPCWYAVKNKKTGHYNGDRKQTTLWKINKPMKSETGHSTQKPVECMQKPIENNSSIGQAVIDPFLGSGTTIIACEKTGRQGYGIELNPLYVDIIINRWQAFTGKKAIHEQTNKTFDEMKKPH